MILYASDSPNRLLHFVFIGRNDGIAVIHLAVLSQRAFGGIKRGGKAYKTFRVLRECPRHSATECRTSVEINDRSIVRRRWVLQHVAPHGLVPLMLLFFTAFSALQLLIARSRQLTRPRAPSDKISFCKSVAPYGTEPRGRPRCFYVPTL